MIEWFTFKWHPRHFWQIYMLKNVGPLPRTISRRTAGLEVEIGFNTTLEVYSKNRLIFLELVGWNLIFDHQPEFKFTRTVVRFNLDSKCHRIWLIWTQGFSIEVDFAGSPSRLNFCPLVGSGILLIWIIPNDYSLFGRLDFQGIHKDSWYTQHPKPLPWSRCSPWIFSLRCTRSSVYKLLRSMGIRLDHSSKVMWVAIKTPYKYDM